MKVNCYSLAYGIFINYATSQLVCFQHRLALSSSCILNCTNVLYFSYGIAAIAPFSHRLAFDNVPEDIQRLRCKVNFQALIFVPHIKGLGEALVKRLRYPVQPQSGADDEYIQMTVNKNINKGPGKFVALHLRFDKVSEFCDAFDAKFGAKTSVCFMMIFHELAGHGCPLCM